MSIKDILVLVDETESSATRLAVALKLAARHEARVTAACLADAMVPALVGAAGGLYGGGAVAAELWDAADAGARQGADLLEADFRTRLAERGLKGTFRRLGGADGSSVARLARTADFCVLGQVNPGEPRPRANEVIEAVMLQSGRPVLMVPFIGIRPTLGHTILVGWDESREAVRAVHDALPLLVSAQSVTLLTVCQSEEPTDDVPGAAMVAHLARKGVAATASRSIAAGLSICDVLLDYAADIDADLFVGGGYGDSPLREKMLGGVTRDLLKHMTIPMMFSH